MRSTATPTEVKKPISFSDDELVMMAHLKMRMFSTQSALERMGRTELSLQQVELYIRKHYESWNRFFDKLGSRVHELRKEGRLPDVTTPQRKSRNEQFFFGSS